MTQRRNDVGVVGLGVMGGALARNFASRGLRVAGYDLHLERARALAQAAPEAALDVAEDLDSFVESLTPPRRILLLVDAGPAVDAVLHALDPLLDPDDVVVDAGNSLYTDTDRRMDWARGRRWAFVGMGVSGGAEGALTGPSMMPGGDETAWERLRPVLEPAAAKSDLGACVTYCGAGSAGHFVKMVHNGIEYGDMQLLAEAAWLLREGLGLTADQAADVFARWNQGELESFLVGAAADVLRADDPRQPGGKLIDAVLDRAGQKGTGRWTVIAAAQLGVPVPTIAAAVDARALSARKDLREQAESLWRPERAPLQGVSEHDLGEALYLARLTTYAQGFVLLHEASAHYGFGTRLDEVARVWTAGCIIRARLLGPVREALQAGASPWLVLSDPFAQQVMRRLPALRRVTARACEAGHPAPALAASLGWVETLGAARGSASLIQAQRDLFGRHGYERVDAPGVVVHSDWH